MAAKSRTTPTEVVEVVCGSAPSTSPRPSASRSSQLHRFHHFSGQRTAGSWLSQEERISIDSSLRTCWEVHRRPSPKSVALSRADPGIARESSYSAAYKACGAFHKEVARLALSLPASARARSKL